MMFSERPRCKTFERNCTVKANHFFLEASERDLHHYCIYLEDVKKNHWVISQLANTHGRSHWAKRMLVYDEEEKSLNTASPLPLKIKGFIVMLSDKDDRSTLLLEDPSSQKSRAASREGDPVAVHIPLSTYNKTALASISRATDAQATESHRPCAPVPRVEWRTTSALLFSRRRGSKGNHSSSRNPQSTPADEDGGLYDQALVGCHAGEQGREQDPSQPAAADLDHTGEFSTLRVLLERGKVGYDQGKK
ncbi:hypothetical protein MLD38_006098 [Melastoma candidum]|uniref:Uncharacterized protein n=1 Tax=Melastoma candidum TaxID=119954 RepID=A0ACB9RN32_9MYRT|nr:hypothetical protein MLD38_006098 [Melastoma candidum]